MKSSTKSHHNSRNGFTVTELVIAITISGIMLIAIIASIITWFNQYHTSSTRQAATADIQAGLLKIATDIRNANAVLDTNLETDPNAPQPAGQWERGSNQLILAMTPRDTTGKALYDSAAQFIGKSDSIVYYLSGTNLMRRIIPATGTGYATNRFTLADCSPLTGGCPNHDVRILSDVTNFSVNYYDYQNNADASSSNTVSVGVSIEVTRQRLGQNIVTENNLRTALINPSKISLDTNTDPGEPDGPIQYTSGLVAGNGGIRVAFASIFARNISSKGSMRVSNLGFIDTQGYRMDVGRQSCGTGASYPAACTTQPITTGFGSTVKGTPICAPGQTVTTGLTGLAACTLPSITMPTFNKQNFVNTMNSTSGGVSCILGFGTKNLNARTRYNGNVQLSWCPNATISGNVYITGNLTIDSLSSLKPASSLTKRPIIVVNGKVNITTATIQANSRGITPIIISFYSADAACSNSDSCTSISNANLYASTFDIGNAIDVRNLSLVYGSLYSYFGALGFYTGSNGSGAFSAQRLDITGLSQLKLLAGEWPS